MVVADLHVHTTVSDGTLEPGELPAAAARAGLAAVAVTDHDRVNPALDAPVLEREGVTVINGVELRVEADDQRVDLLGYGVDPTAELADACRRLQNDRVERARAIVDCVEDRLDVELSMQFEPGVGRPHVARAIADSDAALSYQEAFDELIGNGCPCYREREIPGFERGRELLADACSIVALAHPFRYDDPAAALALTSALDAVELVYPYGYDPDLTPVERAIDDHDLLATGGSDAHGETVGQVGLDAGTYEPFRAALPRPTPG